MRGAFEESDTVFLAATAEASRRFAPIAVESSCLVIDNSSAFREDPGCPLVVCGVNDEDNERGILGEILKLIPTSQWTLASATSYARMFRESVSVHAKEDREPYILKFDLDRLLILAMLRPAGRDHFTLEDIYRGFRTISKMLEGRRERQPVATISFLDARSNRLASAKTPDGEPSLESVLDAMHQAGYEGDLYPPATAWEVAPTSVFANYPFPESLDRMREGSS